MSIKWKRFKLFSRGQANPWHEADIVTDTGWRLSLEPPGYLALEPQSVVWKSCDGRRFVVRHGPSARDNNVRRKRRIEIAFSTQTHVWIDWRLRRQVLRTRQQPFRVERGTLRVYEATFVANKICEQYMLANVVKPLFGSNASNRSHTQKTPFPKGERKPIFRY